MGVTFMDIQQHEAAQRPLLGLDLYSKEALANYARIKWPTNTAKFVAKEWGLSLDEAKGLIAARSSQQTIDKVLKHRNGGWRVAIPLLSAVIGRDLDGFLAEEQKRLSGERLQYEARERELAEMARSVGALIPVWFGHATQPHPGAPELLGEQGSDLGGEQAAQPVEPIQFVRRRP